jgi:mannose-6-phosphate isomerase-like protein (cupin superfamily)
VHSQTPSAFPVSEVPVFLRNDGAIAPRRGDSEFWAQLRLDGDAATSRLVSCFAYERTWNRWERHPSGDELVLVLSGAVDFVLDDGTNEQTVQLTAGLATIVPTGTWHRAIVHEPSTLLFITPAPALTEERQHDR